MTFSVSLTKLARADLEAIKDWRTRQSIERDLLKLERDPETFGKGLRNALKAYRSLRVAGQRYRAIYKVVIKHQQVIVAVIGIRKEGDKKDVYKKAAKRLG